MYDFKEEYKTGIDSIDMEHRKLFEIANKAYDTLMDEFIPDKYDYIIEILEELASYSAIHFQHEEEYMMSIRYKKLFTQKAEHQDFMERIAAFNLHDIDGDQNETIMEILQFLTDWLVEHIVGSDKLIGQAE